MQEDVKEQINALISPEKSVPKFCTGIAFNKLENGDLIMTFFSQSPNKGMPPIMLETILINEDHAKRLVEALKGLVEKAV